MEKGRGGIEFALSDAALMPAGKQRLSRVAQQLGPSRKSNTRNRNRSPAQAVLELSTLVVDISESACSVCSARVEGSVGSHHRMMADIDGAGF
eukprot:3046111-Rhodomonas_salina.1